MGIGTQLIAPNGYRQLSVDVTYHFLWSSPRSERVFLVIFSGENNKSPGAHLVVLNRIEFESAISNENKAIVTANIQSKLPPWLAALEGEDLILKDSLRAHPKKTHASRIEKRFGFIGSALSNLEEIFETDNPEQVINLYARLCNPPQNESRFRLWLLSYLCFGRNKWVLLPSYHRNGHHNRLEQPAKKSGRHSVVHGKGYGYPSTSDMISKIVKGYIKYADTGVTMTSIYVDTLRKFFKCHVVSISSTVNPNRKIKRFSQPDGKPFPSYEQFRYRVIQKFGLEKVQKARYGSTRHRTKLAASKGNFAASVANLMERIEGDAYYTAERLKGYIEGSSLPPLCVVRSRDLLSGMLIGIGFTLGKERSSAYRMMLFCMAVPKVFFCKLFGITITQEQWPSEGLPLFFRVDRGPGAKNDLIKEIEKRFSIRDLPPSWSGQSKATIESSHPRDTKTEGQPTFIQSDLTPIQMVRREIRKLLLYNDSADMSGRIQPNSEMALIHPSPLEYWKFYDDRYRSDAQPMSIADAVITYLINIELVIKNDGVWFGDQKFDSAELRADDILERVARSSSITAPGYCLDLCVRYIWMELNGRLLMLEAQLRVRGDEEDLFVSLAELEQWDETRSKVNSEFREHQLAAAGEHRECFEEEIGNAWDAGKRRSGKPVRNVTTRQEEKESQQQTNSGKEAA